MMMPMPQYISQANLDALFGSDAAAKESVEAFCELASLPGPSDDLSVSSQYLRIVSTMFDQLDANRIPRREVIGSKIREEDLDIAYASLVGLGVSLPVWLHHKETFEYLSRELFTHWPSIRQWLLFLYKEVILNRDIPLAIRYTCKSAIVEFLGLIRDRLLLSWSKTVAADGEVMKMICDLWFIEARDPKFSSWSAKGNTQRESAVFNACFLVAHETGTTMDYDNLLSLFQGEPEAIATVALCHLDHEISREKDWDLHCIAWDLHIITALSLRENIRVALMRQGTIKAASEILEFVVDREWGDEVRVLAARCMVNAIVILRSRIEDMDALPFLSQALQRGLIASLLKCEFLMKFTDQPQAPLQPIILLGRILPGYTVYCSILYLLAIAVDRAVAQSVDTKLSRTGELYKAWNKLKDIVYERRRLISRDLANGHIQTCQNDSCSRSHRLGRFKRCSGCLHAYYCSRKCQRNDWKNGRHKQYCTRVHQRSIRTDKQTKAVNSKDLKFFDTIILTELKKHRVRFNALRSRLTVVELNLVGGQVNVVFDAGGTNANPFGTKCGCEMFANVRWKRMAEAVKEGNKPMVLVRAFIPGGASRKIVLQAIPLSLVLEQDQGGRRKDRVAEKYQFNLIFTCCGSEGLGRF